MSSVIRSLFFRISECSTTSAHGENNEKHDNKMVRTPGIPAIPIDIGFNSGKETGGTHKTGVSEGIASNPLVPIGMGLTCLALLGMFRSSFTGDKMGAQKFMRS